MQQTKFDIIIPPQDIACEPGLQEKLANGDRNAFAWVYKNYCKKVYDYAMLMTNNNEQSEDVVQEVFLKLWVYEEKIRGIENINGYLNMIARNYVLDLFRKEKKELEIRKNYSVPMNNSVNAVDDMINYNETRRLIAAGLMKLSKQPRVVIMLSREYGMKRRDIAKKLNKTELTVKNQLYERLKSLKERISCY
jgi:RNA polymerase sigma factor (sigma-70 family)